MFTLISLICINNDQNMLQRKFVHRPLGTTETLLKSTRPAYDTIEQTFFLFFKIYLFRSYCGNM